MANFSIQDSDTDQDNTTERIATFTSYAHDGKTLIEILNGSGNVVMDILVDTAELKERVQAL